MTIYNHFILLVISLFSILLIKLNSQESIPNQKELCVVIEQMVKNDMKIRSKIPDGFNKNNDFLTQKEIDSLKILRLKIDTHNTETLLKLTKKYGWLSAERLNCPEAMTWLIFRHSDPKYFKQITEIINMELKAKRIDKWHHKLITSHINGRPH